MKQNKVAANIQQDFTDAEKAQARANIDAASITDIPAQQVNSDWNAVSGVAQILNKPTVPTIYLQYGNIHTDIASSMDVDMLATKQVHFTTPQGVDSTPGYFVPLFDEDYDEGKVLTVSNMGWPVWDFVSNVSVKEYGGTAKTVSGLLFDADDPEGYLEVNTNGATIGNLVAGPYKGLLDSGINSGSGKGDSDTPVYIDSDGTFKTCDTIPAALSRGRNIWINQNNEIQTNIPGGHITLTRDSSETWTEVGHFGGAFALMARYNTRGSTSYVEVAIRYLASGYTSHYSFVGTQTVGSGTTVNVKILKKINETAVYTPQQIGDSLVDAGTSDNDIWMLEGTMYAGSLSDFRCSIWYDSSDSKYHVALTAVEIGKVGATN